MKTLQIFKPGSHTSAAGQKIEFGENDVSQTAAVYDPSKHEAPIVVGHPKDNGPAYGWIKALSFDEGALEAEPQQVDPDFAQMVNDGKFKKISASFYAPDSPQNPVPGTYYLRHVGFLGAQPPAVKGMRDASFNDGDDELLIEFSSDWQKEWAHQDTASVFKNLREWLIAKFGKEDANEVVPQYLIDGAAEGGKSDPVTNTDPDYNEEDPDMKELEKLQAKVTQLEADNQTLTTENSTLKGQVQEFTEKEQANAVAAKKATIATALDALIAGGKVLPAEKEGLANYAQTLDNAITFEFGEGEEKQTIGQLDHYLASLEQRPKQIQYGEHFEEEEQTIDLSDAEALSAKAVEYQQEQESKGNKIDIVTAINHIQSQQG